MFGKKQHDDSLPVTVHVVKSPEAFAAAQKVWAANGRTVYADSDSGKEVLHLALLNPDTTIWLERDAGRQDAFEMVMTWAEARAVLADVFVILPGPEKAGDDHFVRQVLDALLTGPATVPLNPKAE